MPPDHTNQNAIRIVDGGWSIQGVFGETVPVVGTPNDVERCIVYTESIRFAFGENMGTSQDDEEDIDFIAILSTIAHEVGHGVHIEHYPWRSAPPNTVMANFPADPEHPVYRDLFVMPTNYDNGDRGFLKIH
jgi:hypothetical protein